jgi:hypothetical protein
MALSAVSNINMLELYLRHLNSSAMGDLENPNMLSLLSLRASRLEIAIGWVVVWPVLV